MLGTLGMGDPWKVTRSQLLTVRLSGGNVRPRELWPSGLVSSAAPSRRQKDSSLIACSVTPKSAIAGQLPDDIGKNPALPTAASCRLGMPVAGSAGRLGELGFSVPDPLTLTSDIATENDRVLANSRLDQGLVSGLGFPAGRCAGGARPRPAGSSDVRWPLSRGGWVSWGFRVPDLVTLDGRCRHRRRCCPRAFRCSIPPCPGDGFPALTCRAAHGCGQPEVRTSGGRCRAAAG